MQIDVEDKETGANDGAEDEKDEANADTQPESGDESVDERGEEAESEAGEDGEEAEASGEEKEDAKSDSKTVADFKAMKDELLKSMEEKLNASKTQEAANPLSDEEWSKIEEKSGMSRQQIGFMQQILTNALGQIESKFGQKFTSYEKETAFQKLASDPEFSDAPQLKEGIAEFLKDFPEEFHTKPEFLKKAAIYARGRDANKRVQRARNSKEGNRRIGGPLRPSSPSAGSPKTTEKLNAQQRAVAQSMGMSEKEYQSLNSKKKSFE